jgi:regulator of protease activity HflC (stomatin/prohibitin superfamily)
VLIDASIIFGIDSSKVPQVHINWKNTYVDNLVRPQARGIIRDAVAQFRVEQVYSTERATMNLNITDTLRAKLAENGIILYDFVLRNITFSPEYSASVEQKQIAEQQAQQAKFVVEQRKQEAQQAIETAKGQAESVRIKAEGDAKARLIQAEAEAEALRLLGEALHLNPELLNYTYIQKLAPGIQVMLVPNDNPYMLPLPTLTPEGQSSISIPSPTPTTTP